MQNAPGEEPEVGDQSFDPIMTSEQRTGLASYASMYLRAWDLHCLIVFVTSVICTANGSERLLNSFRASSKINNVFLKGDKVYIGAVNSIYVINNHLSVLAEQTTGPILDSPLCSPDLNSCIGSKESIESSDNYNKILQYSPKSDLLLVCGSVRQGICEWRDLNTLRVVNKHESSPIPVAANSPNASTTSLIVKDVYDEDQLFVAASLTTESPYRDGFPAVTTRAIPSLITLNSGSLEGEAAVFIRADYRQRFKVEYVTSFTFDNYIYTASIQNQDLKLPSTLGHSVSKLIRVCQNDDKYVSYSEIEIQCRGEDNTNFNIVKSMKLVGQELIGVFTDQNEQRSAVCIYQMSRVQTTFFYNIDRCWGGTSTVGLPHMGRDAKCSNRSRMTLSNETCLLGVGGSIQISEIAVKQFEARTLTAVDARFIQNHFLLALGTKSGDVLQYEILGDKGNRQVEDSFAEFLAGPDPVDKIQFLDEEKLFVVSGNEVLTFKVSVCPKSSSCDQCVFARDPLCGFCLSEGKCTSQIECQSRLVSQCPVSRDSVTPSNSSTTSLSSIFFPVVGLPQPAVGKGYECYFGPFKSSALWTPEGVKCNIPNQKPTTNGKDFMQVPLAIRSSSSRYNIVQQNFTFYDCKVHTVCSKCSQSEWPCTWCSSTRSCQAEDQKCEIKSNGRCPHIDMSSQPSITVPDATNQSISFNVRFMDSEVDSKGLTCEVSASEPDSNPSSVPATFISKEKVQCSPIFFKYRDDKAERVYQLELKRDKELIDKIPITAFKCSIMASDCSSCLALDPRFQCTWCAGGCHFDENCPVRPSKAKADTLCTAPVIDSFSPIAGPIEGGTVIEIRGRDLGSRIQDVQDRVMVGSSKCRVIDYEVSVKILCVVETGTGSGPIRVTIGKTGKRQVESDAHFHFLEPVIRSIQPSFGPMSGGTRLRIHGENLDVGAMVNVSVDRIPCKVIPEERSKNQIMCLTGRSPTAYTAETIRLQVDETIRILNAEFEYRPDPTVVSVDPLVAFESGGRLLTVKGTNFDSVLEAKIFLVSSSSAFETSIVSDLAACQIQNSTEMTCESPRLSYNLLNPEVGHARRAFNKFPVGFHMDGVEDVRNLGRLFSLMTVSDPQFASFKGVKTLSLGHPLVIEGKHLTMAAKPDEYTVTIGTVKCPVIVLESHQLVCRTPEVLPPQTDDQGTPLNDGRSLVVVRFGSGRIRAEIGPLEFTDSVSLQSSAFMRNNLVRLILILVFGIGIVGVGLVLIFFLWRRRSSEHERDYKRIQMQLEQMESNVRNECKQAFAELQTDMSTDLSMTMDSDGIPYHDRVEFFSRLLFKDGMDTTILNGYGTAGIYATHLPNAIIQFESLLYNRQFVFVMVQMVESNINIGVSERSTLASLLMVAMARDMGYCTEVVFTLLSAHIQQSCQNKSNHLLFRRSDSLVEKLFQHWLSFTLHPAMIEPVGPGRQLYLLYKALKFQTEKGPIDVCTGNSRYSLSEQRLLRESVDAQPIVLMIIPIEGFDQAPVPLRVVDCDTISQVKSKLLDALYKNESYTRRMTTDQFDLEWRCPRRGNILLLDDDQPHIKGVKKLHTVRYYNLQSNSVLTMQQRGQHSFTTFRSESGGSSDTTCSVWSSAHLIDQNGIPVSPASACSNVTYYHLTPPTSLKSNTLQSHASALLSLDKKQRKQYVLQRHSSQQHLFVEENSSRNIPEVFLTRLVMCKGTIQQFIDEFLNAVMYSNVDICEVPVVLKYVMDFLDQQAIRNGVSDPEVIHAWKTNAYVLRFWVQLLHNPDSLFDINRQNYVNSSLVVIGQTLIDAFSHSEVPLGKESPSSKLLFAKDIAKFRPVATRMFSRIRQQPRVDNEKFFEYIRTLTTESCGMSAHLAVNELLNWSKANILRLTDLLDQDPVSVKLRLGERLQESARCSLVPSDPPDHIYATLQ
ncbi:unnamed protein product [Bursaphelenchus xylophilus]|uniref:(pine wood nematode) hypothetical protein n=1 Tax=Bursaphelenchus xylophilus TaxID=6326 RepID=A0A7I8WT13_BURXY|nr:unnamed protein product [Bursaphelenchus xylophilus]CAG9115862.1 unnamed protein product [Bursaphelenchus xylophilus]